MMKPIKGKVAKVLNSREIAMNIGSIHGVAHGMHFVVLDPKGEDITDPDSGEVLGSVERPKVKVRVIDVKERLSIASTFKETRKNVGGENMIGLSLGSFSQQLMPPKWVTKYETLKTNERTWEDLDEEHSYVKTGDPIKQVLEEEEEN